MNRTVLAGGAVLDPVGGEVRDADVAWEGGVVAEVGPDLEGDPWAFDDLGSRVRRVWKDGVEA